MILVPAKAVPAVLEECGQKGIKGAVDHLGRFPRGRPRGQGSWSSS